MNYLVFNAITCFVFFGFYVKVTEMQYNQPGDYNIDEFIKKLMTSQRFDELAEKIAEKAAVKIKYYGTNSAALPRNDETFNDRDDDSVSLPRINEDHSIEEEQLKKENDNNNLRNTDSKDSSSPSGKLSLKYKYLSQISPKLEKAQTDAAGKDNTVSRENQEKPRKIKRNKNYSYEELHGNDYKDKYSKELKPLNKQIHQISHKTYNNIKEPERKTNYIPKLSKNKKSSKVSNELAAVSFSNTDFIQNENSQDYSEPEDSQATVIEDLDESNHKVFRSHTDDETSLRNSSNLNTKIKEEIPDSKKLSYYEEKITSSTVKIYRREGDREYTFRSDPEYAEYHEKLAKLPENNVEAYLK